MPWAAWRHVLAHAGHDAASIPSADFDFAARPVSRLLSLRGTGLWAPAHEALLFNDDLAALLLLPGLAATLWRAPMLGTAAWNPYPCALSSESTIEAAPLYALLVLRLALLTAAPAATPYADAHLLLCLACEELGHAPRSGHETRVLLDAYGGCVRHGAFSRASLPDLVSCAERATYWTLADGGNSTTTTAKGDDDNSDDALMQHLVNKCVPHRCEVRELLAALEAACVASPVVFARVQSLLAASLLGLLRVGDDVDNDSAPAAPAPAARKHVYRVFFWAPPAALRALLDAAAAARGEELDAAGRYARDYEPVFADAADRAARHYDVRTAALGASAAAIAGAAVTTATAAAAGPAADATSSEEAGVRARHVFAWLTARRSKRAYAHAAVIDNAMREVLCFYVRLAPALHRELCDRVQWRPWARSVHRYTAAVRASLRGSLLSHPTLGELVPSAAPASAPAPRNALFIPAREPFWPAVAAECARLLDAEGFSERPVDRVLDERGARLLRRVLEAYGPRGPEHVARLHLAYDVPRAGDAAAGRLPLELFGGQAMVMREV